jgi:3-oxoacyl-[acyl-carrier-protein] synthase III
MKTVSLMGVASYMPEKIVHNDFFAGAEDAGSGQSKHMFFSPTERRHVTREESAVDLIEKASRKLASRLNLDPATAYDMILTNVSVPDQAFTGCGAMVAQRLGAKPRWVVDMHNTGCISFVYMMEIFRIYAQTLDLKGALICCVQNAGGRVFAQSEVRRKSQAAVPGDGCGVAYVVPGDASPILSLAHRCFPDSAADMTIEADDDRHYWEAGMSQLSVAFTEQRIVTIFRRGNKIVPELAYEALNQAGLKPGDVDLFITNQPNPLFLRNWREALQLPPEKHFDTYDIYGNLFGAALPVNLDAAMAAGKLHTGAIVLLAGFSHAGDYAAASVVRWGGV